MPGLRRIVGLPIPGIGPDLGETDRMDNRGNQSDGAHTLAAWIRRPELWAITVALLGGGCLMASLAMPISFGAVVLATIGSTCIVAGLLTLVVVLIGRLSGLHARSQRVVVEGRARILLGGLRRGGPAQEAEIRLPGTAASEPIAGPADNARVGAGSH